MRDLQLPWILSHRLMDRLMISLPNFIRLVSWMNLRVGENTCQPVRKCFSNIFGWFQGIGMVNGRGSGLERMEARRVLKLATMAGSIFGLLYFKYFVVSRGGGWCGE